MIYYTFGVRWINPYTEPPPGFRRILIEGAMAPGIERWSSRYTPQECLDCLDWLRFHGLSGYGLYCQSHDTRERNDGSGRTRIVSEAAKRKIRRGRLHKRVRANYPLLAEQFIQDAYAAKPEYYFTPEELSRQNQSPGMNIDLPKASP